MSSSSLHFDDVPIAVVDDEPVSRQIVRTILEAEGHKVVEFAAGWDVVRNRDEVGVICLDLGLGDTDGAQVMRELRALDPGTTVVVITGSKDVATVVDVMRLGAYDYLTKPLDRRRLVEVVARAKERSQLVRIASRAVDVESGTEFVVGRVVGRSSAMRELARQIRQVADSDISVCVLGESGTGKELVAQAIHSVGKRSKGPFVALNCAAIPASLQETELFGHERGAFTGATATHRGRFEQAHQGTLFLDEIGEMSPATQAALLRTLQERTVRRVGGTQDIAISARVVCATHRDLEAEVAAGRFRQDLYYRLVGYPLFLPALRDRVEDVPLLVGHIMRQLRSDVGKQIVQVSPDAMEALSRYAWPGNVRELQNVIHRGMLACESDTLDLAHLPPAVRKVLLQDPPAVQRPGLDAPPNEVRVEAELPLVTLRELERRAIIRVMQATGGNVTKSAKILGLGRATLYRRLAELELVPPGEAGSGDSTP